MTTMIIIDEVAPITREMWDKLLIATGLRSPCCHARTEYRTSMWSYKQDGRYCTGCDSQL